MIKKRSNPTIFARMTDLIRTHVGEDLTSAYILMGSKPGRNAETTYLYKFIRLGYISPLNGGGVTDVNTIFRVIKCPPAMYSSSDFIKDLKSLKKN
jgi:hypothetical protein